MTGISRVHGIIRVAADGSAGSRRAFEWALHEAASRRCAVELVTAYLPAEGTPPAESRAKAERAVEATMKGLVETIDEPVPVSWQVEIGEPADVLVRGSAKSDLLVMGSHGLTGLLHSSLGSVADLCARMAECPVVIVPPPARAGSGTEVL